MKPPMGSVLRWGLLDTLDARRRARPLPERLIVLPPGGLGDNLLTIPALRRLRRAAPTLRLTWVGRRAYAPIMAAAGMDECVAIEDLPRGALDLRAHDAALCFADVAGDFLGPREQVQRLALRIGSAMSKHRPRWYTDVVHTARLGRPAHEALRHLRMLRPFALDGAASRAELIRDGRIDAPPAALPDGLPSTRFVVLHPYSAGHGRQWPSQHWKAMALRLLDRGFTPVFTGSAEEGQRFERAWPSTDRPAAVVDASGRLDLAQLACLIARSDAMVASSTGPLHLAAALGSPAIGLFAPRKGVSVGRWAALGDRAVSVGLGGSCLRRCSNDACRCMAALTPRVIADAVNVGGVRLDAPAGWQVIAPPMPGSLKEME